MCKKLIKNSQPFGKKFQKTVGGDFFDSHCILYKLQHFSISILSQLLHSHKIPVCPYPRPIPPGISV